ncbi:TPA: hypothetical protein ACLUM0_002251, partial [Neisseria gonorrhoeae]
NLIQIYFLGHTQSQSCKNTFVVIQCPNSHIQRYGSVFMAMNIVDAPTIPIDRLLGSYFRNTAHPHQQVTNDVLVCMRRQLSDEYVGG